MPSILAQFYGIPRKIRHLRISVCAIESAIHRRGRPPMADRRYLKQRGDFWFYHRAVPADVRRVWKGRHPILRALGTRDLTKAQGERWAVNAR